MKKLFRRIALQHAIPQYFIFDGLGFGWALYFIWQHQLILAVGSVVVLPLIGTLLVFKRNKEAYADTYLGRFMLSHFAPLQGAWSIFFHLLGYAIFIYGFWMHSGFYILLASSFILLGHLRDKSSGPTHQ